MPSKRIGDATLPIPAESAVASDVLSSSTVPSPSTSEALGRVEAELRRTEQCFHDLVQALPMAVHNADATLTRLHQLATRLTAPLPERDALQEILAVLVELHAADFGVVWLFDAKRGLLREAASIGYDASALTLLADTVANHGIGACAVAFAERRRVVMEDVHRDPAFESFGPVARTIGQSAAHSIPIITRNGELLGVISVHFRERRRPSERERQLAEICAGAAADTVAAIHQRQMAHEADRQRREFLAMLAHELRNPLAAMRYSLEVLDVANAERPALDRACGALDRQLSQMARLVDDLLDVGRISSGKIDLHRELVDLAQVLRHAIETCSPEIDKNGHELVVQLPDTPLMVDGDATRLAQVFGNLLANAAKFTPPHGHITLTLAREGADVVARVRDDGVGIPPSSLPTVFELFTQAEGAPRRTQGGLGIGLGISRQLVEIHGGTITAHSDGQGCGSLFEVRLPLSAGWHPFAATEPQREPRPDRSKRLRIVVADDNEDAAAGLEMLLEAMGHEVHVANDGVEAVSLAERVRPDVIVLDIGMPRLSGLDACRQIRKESWAAHTVIIAVTGWGQAEDLGRSFDAGFDHHVVKPCDRKSLAALLDRAST